MDLVEINFNKTKNKQFLKLGLGIIAGNEDFVIANNYKARDILEIKSVKSSLNLFSNDKRNRFIQWFISLSPSDIRALFDIVQSEKNKDENNYIFNLLAQDMYSDDYIKKNGAIFTPSWLANYITNKAVHYWKTFNGGSPIQVADLSCGPGIFLDYLQKKLDNSSNILGIDINEDFVFLAKMSAINDNNVSISSMDTLLNLKKNDQINLFSQYHNIPDSGYDILIGNPPYVRSQNLDKKYSDALRELYPDFISGNFDLTIPFLGQSLEALAEGGIGAFVTSDKFMSSKYGAALCNKMAKQTKILEIINFNDGQVFPKRTTYTSIIIYVKLPPSTNEKVKITHFPPGLKWDSKGANFNKKRESEIYQTRLLDHPWRLTNGIYYEILKKFDNHTLPSLTDKFPKIIQGIRTGANKVFVIKNDEELNIERELLYSYIDGRNIRSCSIKKSNSKILWPYKMGNNNIVSNLSEEELKYKYENAWEYLKQNQSVLEKRKMDKHSQWYSYQRNQNLKLPILKKILVKEMMPSAQFAADIKGVYAFSSGYGLVGHEDMTDQEYKLWTAVLCTPTMEFQLRLKTTQLHSGWFRVLKQHLHQIKLFDFLDTKQKEKAIILAEKIDSNPHDISSFEGLDKIVADCFKLSKEMRKEIKNYCNEIHKVSKPDEGKINDDSITRHKIKNYKYDKIEDSNYPDLTKEQREKYLPVEITDFNKYHTERYDLRKLVTFKQNKEKEPIHNWYHYTQGFSKGLVEVLLNELEVTRDSIVYDPFMGSGTTLLTSKMNGIRSFGADISPLMTWITQMKVNNWDLNNIKELRSFIEKAEPEPKTETEGLLFKEYFNKAFAPNILYQILGWKEWAYNSIKNKDNRNFFFLSLISILEKISLIRKHGSHYRYLNNTNSVGLNKLNIKIFDSEKSIKNVLLQTIDQMISDIEYVYNNNDFNAASEGYCFDSKSITPKSIKADFVITSPPYLNRNNYFSQQKAELSVLDLIKSKTHYNDLVQHSYRSHVEAKLDKDSTSPIPEVQQIINAIEISKNNNSKIPNMISGYFTDLTDTLVNLKSVINPGSKIAFVVGNSRWGGVVVPVDHLLALIATRLGYKLEKIMVTRYKGNSPQQMKKYGMIRVRESIVILKWLG